MPRFDADYVPRSAMTIFAHPDDAEFLVSGTIAKWAKAGCDVTCVVITSGNVGTHDTAFTREELARTREEEQKAAARVLGVKRTVFLGHNDCELTPTVELRRRLVREIRAHRPEVVVCGDPQSLFFDDRYINHPDHRAAAVAALDAAFPCAEMELLWPEEGKAHRPLAVYVCATHTPNTWVDITGTIETKIEALRAYGSQLGDWDPSERIKERARGNVQNSGENADAPPYTEAFRVMRIHQDEE